VYLCAVREARALLAPVLPDEGDERPSTSTKIARVKIETKR
jgi:hypothetical protein